MLYLNLYDLTRLPENRAAQDDSRSVMVCYHTPTPQKTRPVFYIV